MKSRSSIVAVVFVAVIVIVFLAAVVMPVVAAEITRISNIDDSYIGKEVTVSGVIVTIANNIPETGTIQTYDPGGISVLKLDDGSGTLFVSSDPRLLDNVYEDIQGECTCQFNESNNHCECEPQYEDYVVVAFKLNDGDWQEIEPHMH